MRSMPFKGTILGVLCLFIVVGSFSGAFSLLIAHESEISYEGAIVVKTCNSYVAPTEDDRRTCATRYQLSIGNTGSINQELIKVELGPLPERLTSNTRTLRIVASNAAMIQPSVEGVGTSQVIIHDLLENHMLELSMTGTGIVAVRQLDKLDVLIDADATVINVHPRTGTLARFFRALLIFI